MMEIQRKTFERYISDYLHSSDNPIEPLRLSLVLADKKPATLFDPSSDTYSQPPEQLLGDLNLSYRTINEDSKWIVSPSNFWLDLLPTTTEDSSTGAYSRRLGCVFGYPKEDVENFIQTEGTLRTLQEFVNQGFFEPEEVAYISFAFYRPKESKEGYQRAIAIGDRHYTHLIELADEWQLPELATIARRNYDGFVEFCSGEAKSD